MRRDQGSPCGTRRTTPYTVAVMVHNMKLDRFRLIWRTVTLKLLLRLTIMNNGEDPRNYCLQKLF